MKKGNLILICGLPGSGKTTLAKKLAKERKAIRFCADEWIISLLDKRNNIKEMDRLRNPVEQSLWKEAQKLLRIGVTVILENGFWVKEEREIYRKKAKELEAKVELHFLDVPYAELFQRVSERNRNPDDASFKIDLFKLKEWNKGFEKPTLKEGDAYDLYRVYS